MYSYLIVWFVFTNTVIFSNIVIYWWWYIKHKQYQYCAALGVLIYIRIPTYSSTGLTSVIYDSVVLQVSYSFLWPNSNIRSILFNRTCSIKICYIANLVKCDWIWENPNFHAQLEIFKNTDCNYLKYYKLGRKTDTCMTFAMIL